MISFYSLHKPKYKNVRHSKKLNIPPASAKQAAKRPMQEAQALQGCHPLAVITGLSIALRC